MVWKIMLDIEVYKLPRHLTWGVFPKQYQCISCLNRFLKFMFNLMSSYAFYFYLVVPPDILDCPADRREVTAFDATTTQVFWTEPTASSSLGGNVRVERSHAPGDMFGFGETRVTYRFTDENSGETSVCTFLVIVSRGG